MPKVPFVPRPASVAPSVPEEYLLMAAATMHDMGRLVEPREGQNWNMELRRHLNDVPQPQPDTDPLSPNNEWVIDDQLRGDLQGSTGLRWRRRISAEEPSGGDPDYDPNAAEQMTERESALRERVRRGFREDRPVRITPGEYRVYKHEMEKLLKDFREKNKEAIAAGRRIQEEEDRQYRLSPRQLREEGRDK